MWVFPHTLASGEFKRTVSFSFSSVSLAGAPHRRSSDSSADKEMVKGWGMGGGRVVQDGGRDSTGCGDIAVVGKHLPALYPGPMGEVVAKTLRVRCGGNPPPLAHAC